MRKKIGSFVEYVGLWESSTGRIIIKRSTLTSIEEYSGTLLHEISHALSGADDVTRDFELKLTDIMGKIALKALTK